MKNILKVILVVAVSVTTLGAFAQEKIHANDWINQRAENGIFGLGLNDVYDYITKNNIQAKSKPIVAIICSGIDAEHEALKDNIWINPKEKADGKDNDGNGLIGDINGWNFIGGKDGAVMEKMTREGDREYLRVRAKYDGLSRDDKGFFRYKEGEVKRQYVDEKMSLDEWKYFTDTLRPMSMLAGAYGGYTLSYTIREYLFEFDKELKAALPGKEDYTLTELAEICWDKSLPETDLRNVSLYIMGMVGSYGKQDSWNYVYNIYSGDTQIKKAYETYEMNLNQLGMDGRAEIVKDKPFDLSDKIYGNNTLLTVNSPAGTIAGSVIAGKRGVDGRNNPIAEHAQIMTLVATNGQGEPYLKDVVLAIRYAVDNGASVVILPQQYSFCPEYGKKWLADAIDYAESKNVMVVVPTWEIAHNLDEYKFAPDREIKSGKTLSNLLVVSSSKMDGTPVISSSFGAKGVDLYAPGQDVYSAYPGDTYRTSSGTLMGAATTAGVIALLKTYYPELKTSQIRDILLKSCTSRKGIEVEKGFLIMDKQQQDLFLFEQLCVSGGILNAYNAMIEAGKVMSQK